METKELQKIQPGELQKIDFAADAGDGAQFGIKDLKVPYLTILQANSPAKNEQHAKYVDGAEEGMILNTASNRLFKGKPARKNDDGVAPGLSVVPVMYERCFVEWKPARGGFAGKYDEHDPIQNTTKSVTNEDGKLQQVLPNGNILVETAYYYNLLLTDDGNVDPSDPWGIISMTSMQWANAKEWNRVIKAYKVSTPQGPKTGPIYANQYRVSVKPESKDDYAWWGWNIVIEKELNNIAVYSAAKEFRAALLSGAVKAAEPEDGSTTGTKSDGVPF